jgi:hypothetical protein
MWGSDDAAARTFKLDTSQGWTVRSRPGNFCPRTVIVISMELEAMSAPEPVRLL